ncbi:hypothetical protein BDD43_5710 [Mucilaginibacter gracilis]|uniref:PH (Pleckstrin Homology) domain-containing protein n=1 Tax=Mucilaginibacter gracilis TaxID=423350 RepID=A0A495JBJ8_9SPHI|nr:hypothetical protein [Mucilaginibacter gracilis]RKR85439.1 hypothetical protein BDD43_5710 [Mucilaginibacter gracilis]
MDANTGAQKQFKTELAYNESFLWIGRPKRGIVFTIGDMIFIPISIIWCYNILKALLDINKSPITFFIAPIFLTIGLYIGIGRLFWDRALRRNTLYGITATRIIIEEGIFSEDVSSYDINSIPKIEISERYDSWGTITLNTDTTWFGRNGIRLRGASKLPSLTLIENVREVYNLILKLKNN